jgi:hypothetical protein
MAGAANGIETSLSVDSWLAGSLQHTKSGRLSPLAGMIGWGTCQPSPSPLIMAARKFQLASNKLTSSFKTIPSSSTVVICLTMSLSATIRLG